MLLCGIIVVEVVERPGRNTFEAIQVHFEGLQNGKHRALEMDSFGTPVVRKRAALASIDDWDLNLDDLYWRQPYLVPRQGKTPKLVHKILFSMRSGTPPDKLLAAVRNFAQQEFADQHRYALALHTDEPHPHVHMVLKAMTEGWEHHLNIRKPAQRQWVGAQGFPSAINPAHGPYGSGFRCGRLGRGCHGTRQAQCYLGTLFRPPSR